MKLKIEKPKTISIWKPLLAVLVVAVAIILWPRFAPSVRSPLSFEISGFEGDAQIYDAKNRSWRAPKRGEEFTASQKLKTGTDGIINFKVDRDMMFRLKENSELEDKVSQSIGQKEIYQLSLKQGILLGATGKPFDRKQAAQKAALQIDASGYQANVRGAMYRIQIPDGKDQGPRFGVLRGSVELGKTSPFGRQKPLLIRSLERVNIEREVPPAAQKINREEWEELNEAYELLQKSAAQEAEQIDLSKSAGTLFQYVFDHGTFFTPKLGYANREFFKDPDSGEVILETEYDVFPVDSYDGVYLKSRDFDISKYAGFSIEVRRKDDEGTPEYFSIEVKSKGNVIRRFAAKGFERNWKVIRYDFHARKPTPVNEIVFVFTNARVGEAKKGILQFRNLNLIPLPKTEEAPAAPAADTVKDVPQSPASYAPVPEEISLQ